MNLRTEFEHHDNSGPGGCKCPCCTKSRSKRGGRKDKQITRLARRRMRREGKKEAEERAYQDEINAEAEANLG